MITTRFLSETEYARYSPWVKRLDAETRGTYFGVQYTDEQIDLLVDGIVANAHKHHFLVAEYRGEWIGTVHIADMEEDEVEFGFIVDPLHRGNGIADRMMNEALLWARNRGYSQLYMHCLSHNIPIKKLCLKHKMHLFTEYGETDTKLELEPMDAFSITEETIIRSRQTYRIALQKFIPFLNEVYL
jgi:RimJ/RimL family protein N-acetyltransferase